VSGLRCGRAAHDTIPRPPLTAGRTLTGVPRLWDAGRPGCSTRRRRREAAGMRATPRTAAATVTILTATRKQGCILVMAKVPSRSSA